MNVAAAFMDTPENEAMIGAPETVQPQQMTVLSHVQPAGNLIEPHYDDGGIPINLTLGTKLTYELTPKGDRIAGLRLRFGTHARRNNCNVQIEIRRKHDKHLLVGGKLSAASLVDNEYTEVTFPLTPCTPNETLEVSVFSPDAASGNFVAVWCNHRNAEFLNTIGTENFTMPRFVNPRVSIVIPVFNKALYTYNCIRTLTMFDQHVAKEVIIVDNSSSDETAELCSRLGGGFRVIRNSDNKGFVEACNQGADVATGEFILFLNNDTQVTPGWIQSLVFTMETKPGAGIVGSKLVYPNGRLQEAGGIIYCDASGANYGRNQDPFDPRFSTTREVDYLSGASLMIRNSLWKQIGGFDMNLAPAYYEDVDLCFATRKAGFKVLYCAESTVIHHEGITAGTDVTKGYKAYQEINKKKFFEKWKESLRSHYPPGTAWDLAARRLALT